MKEVEVIKANTMLANRSRRNVPSRLRVAAYCRVSTDSEDQKNSYESQVEHYTSFIHSKPEWSFAGIYADEAITGTQVKKREDFQRLINACVNGEIDLIITKSISRFARNTVDTLKYVRMLKEKAVAVYFEEEKINTLTMDGELLLTVLSSVAQQEVENISANVKKGLKMKMQRGELVGFQGCLGYDYNKESRSISINEEEAEVVRFIFERYIEGAGGAVIARELQERGYKTKRGNTEWTQSTIIGIVRNEKYKGDLLMGKTFTLDPISKRRLDNLGEEDMFYIHDHHEPIVSQEVFDQAQEILKRRSFGRKKPGTEKRDKSSREYGFSCMMECGYCGGTLTRRAWHSGSIYNKVIWHCVKATKHGKKLCPYSKGIEEEAIEKAFVESYLHICQNNKSVLDDFLKRIEEELTPKNLAAEISKLDSQLSALASKKSKLLDMRLDGDIDSDSFEAKLQDIKLKMAKTVRQRQDFEESENRKKSVKRRIDEFRRTLETHAILDQFDRKVFESIVEKVIVGGITEDGKIDPYMLTFVFKTGYNHSINARQFKPPRKNAKSDPVEENLCTFTANDSEKLSPQASDDTCGISCETHPSRVVSIV